MTFKVEIPHGNRGFLCALEPGRPLFLIGANGTGKSTIISRIMHQAEPGPSRYIAAYRQNFFNSDDLDISDQQATNERNQSINTDRSEVARYRGATSWQRVQLPLMELKSAEHRYNDAVRSALDTGGARAARQVRATPSPIELVNRVLAAGNLSVRIRIDGNKIVAKSNGLDNYSLTKMSDGERGAIYLTSEVITAQKDTIIVIDEPERHLHRTIVEPLMLALIHSRPDCYFVISTHDVQAARVFRSDIVVTRGVEWSGDTPIGFNTELVMSGGDVPEDVVNALIGDRNKILYIEGDSGSLDLSIYKIIFPIPVIIPRGSANEVISSVKSVNSSGGYHRIAAYGLIDRDQRDAYYISKLRNQGIYVLPVHSIESIFYSAVARRIVSSSVANKNSGSAQALEAAARAAALAEFRKAAVRRQLTLLRAHQQLDDDVRRRIPSRTALEVASGNVSLSVVSTLDAERSTYDGFLNASDPDGIVKRYKIRSSGVKLAIARALGFRSSDEYEAELLACLSRSAVARKNLRLSLGRLPSAIVR